MSKSDKGDVRSQRQRRRDRYRGCRVCGLRNAPCTECAVGASIVDARGVSALALVVGGSFASHRSDSPGGPGHGGAGLVLVCSKDRDVLASRACGFRAQDSMDAELQAVIRGARWAPGVAIHTDAQDLPARVHRINPGLTVCYLSSGMRDRNYATGTAHALARRLSVEGRLREAPETARPAGVAYTLERAGLSRSEQRQRAVDLLLEHAQLDPDFTGDFAAIAQRLGWDSGPLWRSNPAIRVAAERWRGSETIPRNDPAPLCGYEDERKETS